MKVKGTLRHEFDPELIMELLKNDHLTKEESNRILCDACQVIFGLRSDLNDILFCMQNLIDTKQFWMNNKKK